MAKTSTSLAAPSASRESGLATHEASYFVELTADEVVEALARQPDVHVATGKDRRELADIVTKRAFVATTHGRDAVTIYATRPNAVAGIGAGFLGRLQLRIELAPLDEGTVATCQFTHSRSVQSSLRWLGLLATSAVGLAWVLLGGAELGQRALLFAAFAIFTIPVLLYDVLRLRGSSIERTALLDLVARVLGPAEISGGPLSRMPFRRGHALSAPQDEHDDE